MGWSTQKALMIRPVSCVRMSPDGKHLLFGVKEAVMDNGKDVFESRLFVVEVDDSAHATPIGGHGATDPEWAPDSSRIAYVSDRSGKRNIWLTDVRGSQPVMVTTVKSNVSSYKWSPDGKRLAYTAVESPTPGDKEDAGASSIARVVGKGDIDTHSLYVIGVGNSPIEEGRRLVARKWNIGAGAYPGLYDWSPDCKSIAFTHSASPRPCDWSTANISLVNLLTGHVEVLVEGDAAVLEPLFSPDGRWLVYSVFDVPDVTNDLRFHIMDVETRESRALADTFDRRPCIVGWRGDSKSIFYTERIGTMQQLGALPIDGSPEVCVTKLGAIESVSCDTIGKSLAFIGSALDSPPEVYVCSARGCNLRRTTRINEKLREHELPRTEVVQWESADGVGIEGLLTYPVGYEHGDSCPLVLSVHGGPEGVFSETFVGNPSIFGQVATLASMGYAVLRCNVRGSTGYGPTFRHANFQDWGGADHQDLLSGVDHVIDRGIADSSRIGIVGWSYGGYLAAWASTQTDRFRAAVVGAGITNLISNAGTCDIPDNIPNHFGGEIWQQTDLLIERSPVLQVKYATTPTLILHGEEDIRVPVSQGYELRNCLRRQGCEVEMVVYKEMQHVPHTPKIMQDVMDRTIDWLREHV